MATLMAVLPFTLVFCDDDDTSSKNAGATQTLKVNGEVWTSHSEVEPRYTGDLSEDDWVHSTLVFCSFTKNDNPISLYASCLSFDISIDASKGHGITKGMNLASSTSDVLWGAAGNNEYTINIGVVGSDDYIGASYGGVNGVISGSAIVEDFEYKNFLIIKFSDFKLPPTDAYQVGDAPETLTLDGTVTFTYVDSTLKLY